MLVGRSVGWNGWMTEWLVSCCLFVIRVLVASKKENSVSGTGTYAAAIISVGLVGSHDLLYGLSNIGKTE